MKRLLFCALSLLPLLPIMAQEKAVVERAVVVEKLDIAPVWAGHPVGFALLTHAPYQWVAFYDDKRQMTLAQRQLHERKWTFTKLPVTTGWDSHNYITMALDADGFLHLSGDMHVVPLKYFRSTKPFDASTLERIEKMVGSEEQKVTYPQFLRGPKNELIFTYRDGSSGNGNQIFNVYDLQGKTWKRLLDKPLTDGEGERNAYFHGPIKGPDGYFHLSWMWRETPDAATNHDISYARSKDLLHWEDGAGKPLSLPIKLKDSPLIDPVPVGGGMINPNNKIGFDDKGRVVVTYHKNDAQGYTQPFNARLENGAWKKYQITDWPYQWNFGGGGSLNSEIGIGPVVKEADGRLTQTFRHIKFGGGTWRLDPQTLKAIGTIQRQNTPPELGKIEGTFQGLKAKTTGDSGASDKPGIRYLLRWETLESNRDKPRPAPFPEPSMLRLYAVKTVSAEK